MDGKSEYLICIGLLYSQEWNGQLSEAATAILQQHATQGDLTELQVIALRWRALAQQAKDESHQIHFKVLFEALKDLEKHWDRDLLSNEEVSIPQWAINIFPPKKSSFLTVLRGFWPLCAFALATHQTFSICPLM